MSEESISYGEDKENLLYISKKINIDEFGLGEEGLFRESISTIESVISTKPVGSDLKILEQISGEKTFSNPELAPKLKPFHIEWSFGINAKVGIINLTNETRKELFFSGCHSSILYDYCTREMKHMEGHQNIVNCISTDGNGDWLVSSDGHKDGCIIVWNSRDSTPVYTLFNVYPDSGVLLVTISNCARYLVSIGEHTDEYYKVDFWLWTLGEEKPNGTLLFHKVHGPPVKVCFNPDVQEHIMVVFEKQVFLLIWDSTKNEFCEPYIPQITNKAKIGDLTCGTYINHCHESYVSSTRGCILVFRTTLYSKAYEEGELNNSKLFINSVKVTPASIGVVSTTEGKLVVGDAKGHIYFFDKRVRILYWIRNFSLGPITDISFAMTQKTYEYEETKILVKRRPIEDDYTVLDCDYKDIQEEINKFVAMEVPFDATLENKSFVVRDFFVSTSDCNIYAVDFLHNVCTPLFQIADADISALDAHDEKPYIVIGYENGRVSLINYDKKEQIANTMLPKCEEPSNGDTISCIKYSYESLHLICGRINGEIWILEPVVLTPKMSTPFRCTNCAVLRIEFSYNSLQFAYYDSNKTVLLFIYNSKKSCWEVQGKLRSHYDNIHDMMFFPENENYENSSLYTIGADRHLVEYNSLKVNEESDIPFGIILRERIEQTAIPMTFVYYVKQMGNNKNVGYFLLADDKHKLKLFHETTKVPRALVLGPAFGCFEESHIKKMRILPGHNYRYMVFSCKKHIGIQILPADGNPYKYTGYLAHPVEVVDFVVSHDGKYAFTFGVNDRCVLQWEIRPRSVELLHLMGGTELEPYYCLLEGGKNGWLFHEIQDLFFYMQILQQENIDLPRRVSDTINLTEIPDLVRTCGYYPSDFELETMMIDIRYRDFDESGLVRDELTFIEFVKLFINHRPAYGYSLIHMNEMFENITKMSDYPKKGKIDSHDLVYLLQTLGEPSTSLHRNLTTLLRINTYGENNFEFLPPEISTNFLFYEMLGIDPKRSEKQMEEFDREHHDDSDE